MNKGLFIIACIVLAMLLAAVSFALVGYHPEVINQQLPTI